MRVADITTRGLYLRMCQQTTMYVCQATSTCISLVMADLQYTEAADSTIDEVLIQ
jgi:hypothetical protein